MEAKFVAAADGARLLELLGTHPVETGEQSRLGGELVDNQQVGHIEVAPPQVHDSGEYRPGWGANLHQM